MKTKLLAILLLSGSCIVAQAQSWTLFSSSLTTQTTLEHCTNPATLVAGYAYATINFTFSPAYANHECIGDNPSPGPSWDSPWTSLFANSPTLLNDTVYFSNSGAGAVLVTQDVSFPESYGTEVWVYDSSTQAARYYDVCGSITYSLYIRDGSNGNGGPGG
ncbi:MAG: hypothetical protein ACYC96_06440 [Fimbriimonadaceae bacterium]